MVMKIRTYREDDQWFFDAGEIQHEEFIEGVPELFYLVTGDEKVRLLDVWFSPEPFKGAVTLDFVGKEDDGYVYEYQGNLAWLCPVLENFLSEPPTKLYARIDVIETGSAGTRKGESGNGRQ